jgi:hypothetical protein
MSFSFRNILLPDRARPMRILRGPFRNAVIVVNPRNSLRKLAGLYEHELNSWLEKAFPRINRVLDVGANDGYFAFGCAAALRRLGETGEIIAFEPDQQHAETLRKSVGIQRAGGARIRIVQALVGKNPGPGTTTLDAVQWETGDDANARTRTLVKIDVEGAELDVLDGASSWLNSTNYFLIEVHDQHYLDRIARFFAARDLRLIRVDQRPLPLLGRERRSRENWWMLSDLDNDGERSGG